MNNVNVIEKNNLPVASDVQQQIITAHQFPRNEQNFLQKAISRSTITKEIAESCNYTVPIDGKNITGASVRLAEIIAQTYGNLRFDVDMLDVLPTDRRVTARALAWDLETNVGIRITVPRSIMTKAGKRYSSSMVTTTSQAALSIAYRNAIFKIVPKAYIDQIYESTMEVAFPPKNGYLEKFKKAVEYFSQGGYTKKDILEFLNKKTSEIGREELMILGGLKTRIEDGTLQMDMVFSPDAPSENESDHSEQKLEDELKNAPREKLEDNISKEEVTYKEFVKDKPEIDDFDNILDDDADKEMLVL